MSNLRLRIHGPFGNELPAINYDPFEMTMTTDDNVSVFTSVFQHNNNRVVPHVRLVIGRSCNYRCSYCNQAPNEYTDYLSEARNDKTKLNNVLDETIKYCQSHDIKQIQLWGGEPLLYFDTIKYIVEYVQQRDETIKFNTTTNGSLFNNEIVDFLITHDFQVNMSHDGPGQHLRHTSDYLSDSKYLELVKRLYHNTTAFNISSVITNSNNSHEKLIDFFTDKFDDDIRLSAYDVIISNDNASNCRISESELNQYSRNLYNVLYRDSRIHKHFNVFRQTVYAFIKEISTNTPVVDHGKCKSLQGSTIVVDLYGNKLTCHNEDIYARTKTGESFNEGSIFKLDECKRPILPSWKTRTTNCKTCPVLYFCHDKCPHVSDELHHLACDTYFYQNIVMLGYAISIMTGGGVLTSVEGDFHHQKDFKGFDCTSFR